MQQHEEAGSRPIGSLLSKIEPSLKASGFPPPRSTSPPGSSATTGSPRPGSELAKSPGRSRFGIVAAWLPKIEEAVARGRTDEIEGILLSSLSPLLGLSWRGVPTDDPSTTYAEQRAIVDIRCRPDEEDLLRLLVAPTLLPASRQSLIRALSRLRALTVHRSGAAEDAAMIFTAFADELGEYPADAVLAALAGWPRRNKFWPTLAEILDNVRDVAKNRLAIARALSMEVPP